MVIRTATIEDVEKIAAVDGFVTDEKDLRDEMYEDAGLHNENGAWQMIFGVNTLPKYWRRGLAGQLLRQAISDAKKQGRKGKNYVLGQSCRRV